MTARYENGSLIGLGSMGQPMAANSQKKARLVRSFDLERQPAALSSVRTRPRARSS